MRDNAKKFTHLTIPTLPDGKYVDPGCPNLYLWVRNNGRSRVWQYRYTLRGIPDTMSIGSIKSVTLAQARARVNACRVLVDQGIDPKKASAPTPSPDQPPKPVSTFRQDAEKFFQHVNRTWRSEAYRRDWLASLENHVLPHIGDRDTASLSAAEIVAVIEPLWGKLAKADTILDRIRQIIEHAIELDDHDRFKGNPAERVRKRLPQGVRPRAKPHGAMPWTQAPELYRRLVAASDPYWHSTFDKTRRARHGRAMAAKALRFLLLCCTPRADEINKAEWSEIVGDDFHVPAERMKSGRARVIPLTPAAQKLLGELRADSGQRYIFPTLREGNFVGHIQDDAMRLLFQAIMPGREAGKPWDVHGLRATFRTWVSANATSVQDHDAAEIALDHVIGGKVARAYDRPDMLQYRRDILSARWADFLLGKATTSC